MSETVTDICAELRAEANALEVDETGQNLNLYYEVSNGTRRDELNDLADRIEAAHKCEVADALNTGAFVEAAHRREIEATAESCCQLGRLAGYGASEIKHRQEPVGDAAKMREALERIRDLAYEVADINSEGGARTALPVQWVVDTVTAALAAPPRNCDIGTAEEQVVRHHKEFCGAHHGDEVCCAQYNCEYCFSRWAQTPHNEGGVK